LPPSPAGEGFLICRFSDLLTLQLKEYIIILDINSYNYRRQENRLLVSSAANAVAWIKKYLGV
jgi:hypothetical protein